MSVKVMGLVWDYYPEGGGELLTALKLADHADHNGDRIWPGVQSLALLTRQSGRTVQRHLGAMLANGWLEIVEPGGHGPTDTTRYRIPVDRVPGGVLTRVTKRHPSVEKPVDNPVDNLAATNETRVTPETDKGDNGDKKGDTAMSPESSLEATVLNREPARSQKKTALPPGFAASEAVMTWARKKGIEPDYVASCLEAFTTDAQANARRYASWDAALMTWIRREPSFTRGSQAAGAAQKPTSPTKPCAYCTAAATGSVGGIAHCREHAYDAMDRKSVPAPA